MLDFSKDSSEVLREKARTALTGSASPHFYVAGFGFGASLHKTLGVAASAFGQEGKASGGEDVCGDGGVQRQHFDLNECAAGGNGAAVVAEFRESMHALATRLVGVLFDVDDANELGLLSTDGGLTVDTNSPLSVKWYRAHHTSQDGLGAHVDRNMFTLLWSNSPGLQILRPDASMSRNDLMHFGMPLIGAEPVLSFEEEDFVALFIQKTVSWRSSSYSL